MGRFRTKEDDVARISTSVYISNIPESIFAKDLFHACKQYGHVVDSFIPIKRDKNGKRFGFVRFINVFNTERLVNNLCTVWIDRYKIQANIAHFQRNNGNESKAAYKNGDDVTKRNSHSIPKVNTKANENSWGDKSYMGAVKGALLGRVKEFASLANLKVAIGNEGFAEIIIKYMGELWVMLEFQSMETLNKFRENVSIASWFSQIINATSDFETEGRIAWVEVEGVPLKLWSGNTFSRIATKWGKFLDVDDQDDNYVLDSSIKDDFTDESDDEEHDDHNSNEDGSDNLMSDGAGNIKSGNDAGYDSEAEVVQETFFEKEEPVDRQDEEEKLESQMDKSEDPFNIYPLLNKPMVNDESANISGCSLKFPPGFTPPSEKDEVSINEAVGNKLHNIADVTKDNNEKVKDTVSSSHVNSNNKEVGNDSSSLGQIKKSECPRTDGSILGLLEDVIKVGQVMGYNMEGCISNMGKIISSKGVEEVYR
ncbi:nucleotide-binding alpha-beta plait domain-containing protein [Tanacetum coccineum]